MLGSMLVSIIRAYITAYMAASIPSYAIRRVVESMLRSILEIVLGGIVTEVYTLSNLTKYLLIQRCILGSTAVDPKPYPRSSLILRKHYSCLLLNMMVVAFNIPFL
jgi:hypothetical protein